MAVGRRTWHGALLTVFALSCRFERACGCGCGPPMFEKIDEEHVDVWLRSESVSTEFVGRVTCARIDPCSSKLLLTSLKLRGSC